MRKRVAALMVAISALLMIITSACTPPGTNAGSYAEDRARIEDLQARYMFALDFGDLDTYVSTFTEDGILDIIGQKWQGRQVIKDGLEGLNQPSPEGEENAARGEAPGPYPSTGRHNITNIVLKIDGDKAVGRAYWFHYGNNNADRKATLDSYGYYEDELAKVNGEWLFSKRVIYNEQVAEWIGSKKNPCW